MTDIKSDDTDDMLSVVRAQDGDMHIGVNGFNFLRFRNMIGGGMNPYTYCALLKLEQAVKRDLEERNTVSYHERWKNALCEYGNEDPTPRYDKEVLAEIRETLYNQSLEVANWHQNGELVSMDDLFEENDWLEE